MKGKAHRIFREISIFQCIGSSGQSGYFRTDERTYMRAKRLFTALFLMAAAVFFAASCGTGSGGKQSLRTETSGSETGEKQSAEGVSASKEDGGDRVITVGCEATTPGWVQTDENGKLSGYDYDVWQEIGRRIGYQIDYKVMEWNSLWLMLGDGRLDSVGEQISYNAERSEKYELSEPYAYNIYSLLCAKDNEKLKSMEDLKSGMTISCETNTSDGLIVAAIDKEFGIELKPMYYSGMSVQDVALGRCDLWPRAYTSCVNTVKEVDNLRILGNTNVVETNVFPFSRTERGEKLCELVSGALREMKEDGSLKKISEKWFDMDISIKPEGAEDLN